VRGAQQQPAVVSGQDAGLAETGRQGRLAGQA
jgi:hypothetical protein